MEFTEPEKTRENEEIKFSLLMSIANTAGHFGHGNLSFVLLKFLAENRSHTNTVFPSDDSLNDRV